jgi:hypothetical protein
VGSVALVLFVVGGLWWAALGARFGEAALVATFAAALSCWFGVVAAHLVSRAIGPAAATSGAALLGMSARMAFPLALCLMAALRGGPLVDGGLVYATLVFYPIALAVDTMAVVATPGLRPEQSARGS